MSVINQMLKDLDKRQQHNPQAISPLVEDSGRSIRAYLLIALVLLVLLFSAWLALRYFADFDWENRVEVINEPVNSNTERVVESEPPSQQQTQSLQAVAQAIDVEVSSPQVNHSKTEVQAQPSTESQQLAPASTPPPATIDALAQANSQRLEEKPSLKNSPATTASVTNKPQAEAKPSMAEEPLSTVSTRAEDSVIQPSVAEGELQIKPLELSLEQRVAMYKRRGFQALEQNQPSQARVEFAKALQLEHQAHEVREQLAALVYASGDLARAVNLLEEGLQLQSQRSSFRLMLARIFVQQQQLPQALAYLEGATPEVAGNVDYYAMQAGLAQRLDRQQLALSSYQRLLRYEPNRARWWLGYAIANDKLENYAEALSAYRQAQLVGQLSANSSDFVASRITQLEQ